MEENVAKKLKARHKNLSCKIIYGVVSIPSKEKNSKRQKKEKKNGKSVWM